MSCPPRKHFLKVVLFRTDGGAVADVGTGHIYRSLLIADQLRDACQVIFSSVDKLDYEYGHAMIRNLGYPLHLLSPDGYDHDLARLIEDSKPDFIICDIYQYDENELRILKQCGVPLMTYDHFESHRKYSDYPINAFVEETGNPYSGPGFAVIPPTPKKIFRTTPERIFICFGGFDYLDITLKLVDILSQADITLPVDVAIGSGYSNDAVLSQYADSSGGRIRIHRQSTDFQKLMAGTDIAFVAGGLVFFQTLSLGITAIVICQYEHQMEQVRKLARHNAFILLGMGNVLDPKAVTTVLSTLIPDLKLRNDFYERGRRLVDGDGLKRIVNIIMEHMEK